MYHLLNCTDLRRVTDCNFTFLSEGDLHPDRVIGTHDLFYLQDGGWEVFEDGTAYQLCPGDVLFLHAGHHHWGQTGCLINTSPIYIHCDPHPQDCFTADPSVLPEETMVRIDSITHCQGRPRVKRLFQDLLYYYYSGLPQIGLRLSALLLDLFYELSTASQSQDTGRAEDDLVNQVIYQIRTAPQVNHTLRALSETHFVSESTLSKRFRAATGSSVHQYQLAAKLEMARLQLITQPHVPVKEISAAYGFCDEFHFSKLFKKKYGVSPAQLRRAAR